MNEELRATVLAAIDKYGENLVINRIEACHNGRLDGYVVTNENLHLFRVYRNSVSGSGRRMVDEAKGVQ